VLRGGKKTNRLKQGRFFELGCGGIKHFSKTTKGVTKKETQVTISGGKLGKLGKKVKKCRTGVVGKAVPKGVKRGQSE